jgi:hypothetical protein
MRNRFCSWSRGGPEGGALSVMDPQTGRVLRGLGNFRSDGGGVGILMVGSANGAPPLCAARDEIADSPKELGLPFELDQFASFLEDHELGAWNGAGDLFRQR